MEDAHTYSYEDVLTQFAVEPNVGLSDSQVENSQEKYGPNGELNESESEYSVIIGVICMIPGNYMRNLIHHSKDWVCLFLGIVKNLKYRS